MNRKITKPECLKKIKNSSDEEMKGGMRSLIEGSEKSATRKQSRNIQILAYVVN